MECNLLLLTLLFWERAKKKGNSLLSEYEVNIEARKTREILPSGRVRFDFQMRVGT